MQIDPRQAELKANVLCRPKIVIDWVMCCRMYVMKLRSQTSAKRQCALQLGALKKNEAI
jgi:hypothetical protein